MERDFGKFDFEKPGREAGRQTTRRERAKAEQYLPILLQRLTDGRCKALVEGARREAMVRYCMEVLLNIDWYKREEAKARKEWLEHNQLACLLGVLAGILVVVVSIFGKGELVQAQLSLVVGAIFFAGRFVLSGTDYKSRLGAFWKASSGLKSNFYALEESWRNKPVVDESTNDLTDDFFLAIEAELMKSQVILAEERKAFFDTYKNPSEVLSTALTAVDDLRTRAASLDQARTKELQQVKEERKTTEGKQEAEQKAFAEALQKLAVAQQQAADEVTQYELLVSRYQAKKNEVKVAQYEEELYKAQARLHTATKALERFKK